MPGGARAHSGPAPDPNALRRDRDGDSWVTLPAEGRSGSAPKWPLAGKSKREEELWNQEWRRPQAVIWEANGQEIEVALYVRSLIAAEKTDAATNARTLVKQQQEALGLSLPGLLRNHWKIEDSRPTETKQRPAASASQARNRFRVVTGGAE